MAANTMPSLPLGLQQVRTLCGVSAAGTLSSILYGGSLAQIHWANAYSGVTSLAAWAGKSYPAVELLGNFSASGSYSGGALATVLISSNGNYTTGGTNFKGSFIEFGFPYLHQGSASDLQVNVNKTSGLTPTGAAVNTWLDMGTSNCWWSLYTDSGTKTCSGTLYIRVKSTQAPIYNTLFSLSVDSSL